MLTGVHFLLTYNCNFECDHCFVHSRPGVGGTFTIGRVRDILDQLTGLGTIEKVFFEGGEPALYYATVLEGVRLATERGFGTGIVTNAYWALSEEDAELWLAPLAEAGLSAIAVSDDELHSGESAGAKDTPAKRALTAAEKLGVTVSTISCAKPEVETDAETGRPTVTGDIMFRGRAVEKLAPGLPRKRPEEHPQDFGECPHEDLRDPGRVHVDTFGNVHLCQGLCMGNVWEKPFPELVRDYDPEAHPICGPLVKGGPLLLAKLAAEHGFELGSSENEEGYVDACHLCYLARRSLIDKFPQFLAPRQIYGL